MRPWLLGTLKAVVSLVLLAYVLRDIGFVAIANRIAAGDPFWSLVTLLGMLFQVTLVGVRWKLVASALHRPMQLGAAVRMTFVGQFFNQVLPSAIGGDVVRGWMAYRAGMPMALAAAGLVVDRLSALIVVLVMVTLGLPALLALDIDTSAKLSLFALIGAGSAGCVFLLSFGRFGRLAALPLLAPLRGLSQASHQVFLRSPANLKVLSCSTVTVLLIGVSAYFVSRALGIVVPLYLCILLMPVVVLLTMIPISLAGWGLREVAMVEVLGRLGVAQIDALTMSVGLGLSAIAVGLPGGILWLRSDERHAFREH